MRIRAQLLIKSVGPAARLENRCGNLARRCAAKLPHTALKRKAAEIMLLPAYIVPVLRREVTKRTDCDKFKRAPEIRDSRAVVTMQRVKRAGLKAVGRVEHAAMELIMIFANGLNPITPKAIERRKLLAVMVGRGQSHVVWQVHDAGPGSLVNKIGRPRTFAAYERESLVGQEIPLKAKVFLKWRFRHGLPRDSALPDRQA